MKVQQNFQGEQERVDDPVPEPGQTLSCVFGEESPGIEAER